MEYSYSDYLMRERSAAAMRRSYIKKKRRPKAKTVRIYGSEERRQFCREQPCAACGRLWHSENAHVVKGDKGMGYKASAECIAPLCAPDIVANHMGCHRLWDTRRWDFERHFPDFDAEREAAKLEASWQQFTNGET